MKLTNRHCTSSRRNVSTSMMSSGSTSIVSSPRLTSAEPMRPTNFSFRYEARSRSASSLMSSPLDRAGTANLLLQQQHAVEQRLSRRRAARYVDVDRHDAIAAAHDRIGIVVVAAAVGA